MKKLFGILLLVTTVSTLAGSVFWRTVAESGFVDSYKYWTLQSCLDALKHSSPGTTCVAFTESD